MKYYGKSAIGHNKNPSNDIFSWAPYSIILSDVVAFVAAYVTDREYKFKNGCHLSLPRIIFSKHFYKYDFSKIQNGLFYWSPANYKNAKTGLVQKYPFMEIMYIMTNEKVKIDIT